MDREEDNRAAYNHTKTQADIRSHSHKDERLDHTRQIGPETSDQTTDEYIRGKIAFQAIWLVPGQLPGAAQDAHAIFVQHHVRAVPHEPPPGRPVPAVPGLHGAGAGRDDDAQRRRDGRRA